MLISNLVKVPSPTLDPSPLFSTQRINAIFAVWSILTSSNAILKQWIGIPASAALSSLASAKIGRLGGGRAAAAAADDDPDSDAVDSSFDSGLVTLAGEDKTLGLLLSASRLRATNVNWTFESVRASHGVGG